MASINPALIFALFFFSYAPVQASTEQNEIWFACAVNSDCALTPAFCGETTAVNKKFLVEHEDWLATHRSRCQAGYVAQEKNTAVCDKRKCAAIMRPPAKVKKQ